MNDPKITYHESPTIIRKMDADTPGVKGITIKWADEMTAQIEVTLYNEFKCIVWYYKKAYLSHVDIPEERKELAVREARQLASRWMPDICNKWETILNNPNYSARTIAKIEESLMMYKIRSSQLIKNWKIGQILSNKGMRYQIISEHDADLFGYDVKIKYLPNNKDSYINGCIIGNIRQFR